MFKEHFRSWKQNSLHQSRFSLFNKFQNLVIEKSVLSCFFDIIIFFKLSQWWNQRGTNFITELFLNTKRVLCATIVLA